jgi:hypothetical protein
MKTRLDATQSPSSRLRQRSGVEARPLPKGALLVDMNTGSCFKLNQVGAEIWTMLVLPHALDDICRDVAKRYQRPIEEIGNEIRELVEHLTREQLVVENDLPAGSL